MLKNSIIPSWASGRNNAQIQVLKALGGAGQQENSRLREAAKEFEGIMVEMMVKAMRKNVPESPLLGESNAREIFQEMLDSEYVRLMVDRGGFGIADLLVNQLGKK